MSSNSKEKEVKNRSKRNFTWTPMMDTVLSEAFMNQLNEGNMLDGKHAWELIAWTTAINAMQKEFGITVTKQNIQSRLKTWEKHYDIVSKMLAQSGFSWDFVRGRVDVAGSEWNDYVKDEDEEDEEETNEEEGGLSKSGKELKKLLGRTGGMNESDQEEDDDDDEIEDESSPVLAPKQKDAVKEEPAETSPSNPASTASARGTPPASKSEGKRKTNGDDAKAANNAPPKKVKAENDVKPVEDEPVSPSKGNVPAKEASSSPSPKTEATSASGPVTEDEIRAVLVQETPVTTYELVGRFKSRLKSKEEKEAVGDILRRISKILKRNEASYVVLKDK